MWRKRGERWDGVVCLNGGGFLDLGKALVERFSSDAAAQKLVEGGLISEVESSGEIVREGDSSWMEGYGESQLAMAAREHTGAAYVYIFEDGEWKTGLSKRKSLRELIEKIGRAV